MYTSLGTMKEILDKMSNGRYVLPAIQREYVWKPEQICRFFDSLMQGFPVGIFLFWELNQITKAKQNYFKFAKHIDVSEPSFGKPLREADIDNGTIAVLDGQQRLTSLRIGLAGSYKAKKGDRTFLYIDLIGLMAENENNEKYKFKFLPDNGTFYKPEGELWYKVSDCLKVGDSFELGECVLDELAGAPPEVSRLGRKTAQALFQVVREKEQFYFYLEKSDDMQNILQIFIRLNSAGTVLSSSDLLLSTAVMRWENGDVRAEIQSCLDECSELGLDLPFSKDFVLKSGLILSDLPISFKVDNFSPDNMRSLESRWPSVRAYIKLAVELVAEFGLSGKNMKALGPIYIVAYYLYKNKRPASFIDSITYQADRNLIRDWVVRSLLKKSVWSEGIDATLGLLRSSVDHDCKMFPASELESALSAKGKSLIFTKDEIDELLAIQKGDRRCHLVLSLLYPYYDLKHNVHVDHFYPRSKLSPKYVAKASNLTLSEAEFYRDRLCNLMFLDGMNNMSKNGKIPDRWVAETYPDQINLEQFKLTNHIPVIPTSIDDFKDFCMQREKIISGKLAAKLSHVSV